VIIYDSNALVHKQGKDLGSLYIAHRFKVIIYDSNALNAWNAQTREGFRKKKDLGSTSCLLKCKDKLVTTLNHCKKPSCLDHPRFFQVLFLLSRIVKILYIAIERIALEL
jgi:hypothetical protein